MKKGIILFFSLYVLVLLQLSFFPFFPVKNYYLNLVLIAVIIINLSEKPERKVGLFLAFWGGFLLDMYSEKFIGFWILTLLVISIFIKSFFKRYVRNPLYR